MSLVKDGISFNGPLIGVGTDCGYGYAAVQLIKAWNNLGIPVWWGKDESPIAFSFGQPEWYQWQREDQFKIGYTPWESTALPKSWIPMMNNMDEIWTTSEACENWFRKAGIRKPIRVLHHGLNSEHYPARKRKLHEGEAFKFLHIGEPAERKGGAKVYEAFMDLYEGRTDVHLTIKGNPTYKVTAPNVTVIGERYTQEEMTQLYLDHHAFLYPCNGEGFGFLPFQAAATGMPTLVTNWSGPEDYIEYCWPIKREKKLIKTTYEPHEGWWAEPNIEDMKLWMDYFVESPNYFFGSAYRKAKTMQRSWGWDIFAKKSLEWMTEKLSS